ncbi:MAG: serine protease [Thermodesulfovibrio sp.]|nr:serine protease [Thermodesulfovibrio sp.]
MSKKLIPLSFFILLIVTFSHLSFLQGENKQAEVQREILVITVNSVINPVAAEYVSKSIKKASEMRAEALIIELDTPGGLDTSMRSIVKEIIGSSVPVVVYVSPSGARAASAGVFITLSAHIAVMSPGTNIGAAHPVAVGEKMDKVMAEKATNDAAAYIKSIAEQHGRNAKWAENAVRKSVSITETEALKNNVIDLISKDINSLLSEIDNREVKTAAGSKILKTSGAKIVRHEAGIRNKILNFISDPSVAYMLMLLGFYGLFFELTNPGSLLPGIVGAIALILAFYSFQTLPVNYAGLLLIITGIILFILEVKVASCGMLTVGGLVCLILGSLMLFDSPSPFLRLSLSIILPAAIVTAMFFIVTFRLAYKAHKKKPITGTEGLIGLECVAKTDIRPDGGTVLLHGEFWSAYSDGFILKDEKVIVEDVKGLKVKVRKTSAH